MNDDMMEVIESLAKTNRLLVTALKKAHLDLEDMKEHVASIADRSDERSCSCCADHSVIPQTDLSPSHTIGHTTSEKSVSGPDSQPKLGPGGSAAEAFGHHAPVTMRTWGSGPGSPGAGGGSGNAIPDDYCPYPEVTVSQMFTHMNDLVACMPENSAAEADRKWRLSWLVKHVQLAYDANLTVVLDREEECDALRSEKEELKLALTTAEQRAADAKDSLKYERSQTDHFRGSWMSLSQVCSALADMLDRGTLNDALKSKLDDMLSKCTATR